MKRPLRNLVSYMAGDVGSRVLGFFITVYLARVLEVSAFGIVNIGLSVFGYLLLLGNPGMQVLEVRNAAAAQGVNEDRVHAILSLRLTLAFALIVGTAVAALLLRVSSINGEIIFLFCLSLVPLSLFLDWFFHGKESFGMLSAAKFANSLAYGVAIIAFVHSSADVIWVPISFAIGNVAASLVLLVHYWQRNGRVKFILQPAEWKHILAASAPVGIAAFFAQSAMNLPLIVIGWYASTAEAGVYSAALKIIGVLLMIDRLLNALLLPAITRYFSHRREDVSFFISVIVKVVLIIVVPLTSLGIVLAPLAISAIFGTEYAGAIVVLQILMMYFCCTILHTVFVCTLVASGNERAYTVALNVGSTLLVVGIVAGTLVAGSTGAAAAVVVGELCTLLLMMRQAAKVVAFQLRQFLRPVFAAVGMAVCVIVLKQQPAIVQAVAPILVFAVLLIVTRAVDAREFQFLRERIV